MKLSFALILSLTTISLFAQANQQNMQTMKMNAGIITDKISETKEFYTKTLNFGVTFENEFYLLLHTPNHQAEISFLKPNHPSQQPIFKLPHQGQGVYLTIEVENVDEVYHTLKNMGTQIVVDIRDEVWGDRHFAIVDPNGIGIDVVTYSKPDNN